MARAKSRSTSRARSASRSKKSSSVVSKLFKIKLPFGLTVAKLAAIAAEAFTTYCMFTGSTYAFKGGDRAAGLGFFSGAVAAAAAFLGSLLSLTKLSFIPKNLTKAIKDFSVIWSYYAGYFGVPLIGYSSWVRLGVVDKVCSTLSPHVPVVCTGNGDITDYLIVLMLIFIITLALDLEKRITSFHCALFGFGAPIFAERMKFGGTTSHRIAGCVFGAFIFTFLENETKLLTKLPKIVTKLRVTEFLTALSTLYIAFYSYVPPVIDFQVAATAPPSGIDFQVAATAPPSGSV